MNRPAAALSIPTFPVARRQTRTVNKNRIEHTLLIGLFRMFDLVKVLTNALLEVCLLIWVSRVMDRIRTSSATTRCVLGSMPRLFRYTASKSREISTRAT